MDLMKCPPSYQPGAAPFLHMQVAAGRVAALTDPADLLSRAHLALVNGRLFRCIYA